VVLFLNSSRLVVRQVMAGLFTKDEEMDISPIKIDSEGYSRV
jgi:hypothetical protein